MVIGCESRIVLEELAFVRLFHVLVERNQALAPRHHEDVVKHLQELHVARFGKWIPFQQADHRLHHGHDGWQWIRDQHPADAGAADNDKLGHLHEGHWLATLHHEPAEYADGDYRQANQNKHSSLVSWYRAHCCCDG